MLTIDMTSPWFLGFLFLLGLEFGSFANVCIYRWPRQKSVSWPRRSHCPWCNRQIAWFDNIPVLSYLFLRGRCRGCRSAIGVRYPITELLMPLLWLLGVWIVLPEPSLHTVPFLTALFGLLFVLVVTTQTDLAWKMIPDKASYALITLGVLTSYWNPFFKELPAINPIALCVLEAALIGGILFLFSYVGALLMGREILGMGDVKLLMGITTTLGLRNAMMALFIGSFLGGLVGTIAILTKRIKRRDYIPFGPWINLGAFISFFIHVRVFDKSP